MATHRPFIREILEAEEPVYIVFIGTKWKHEYTCWVASEYTRGLEEFLSHINILKNIRAY